MCVGTKFEDIFVGWKLWDMMGEGLHEAKVKAMSVFGANCLIVYEELYPNNKTCSSISYCKKVVGKWVMTNT